MKKKIFSVFTAILMFCSVFCVMPNVDVSASSVTLSSTSVVNGLNSQVGASYPSGHCLAYIADFWAGMGATRSSACCASKYGDGHIDSTSMSNIPVGADVFFGNCGGGPCGSCKNSYYGHIGIYVGNGEFVHATGGTVQKSSLSNWSGKYRGWGWHDYVSVDGSSSLINTTVDTSYATPWQGQPTATSGKITVYNEYGTAYASNVRNIAYNDNCTVHEVYTSGFCKVTYPTSNGIHTEYAKVSDFNVPRNENKKPDGVLDAGVGETGGVFVRGWGYDPDNTNAKIEVHVYVWDINDMNTPIPIGNIKADKHRPDVNDVFGCGEYHGFEEKIITNLPTGDYFLRVALIDTDGGEATWRDGGTIKITADTTPPTISSVTISDVTINGYKVTVKASDNIGVSKVAIPTWTDKNGQDDLFANWLDTALATKVNDTTWTYNVKVSDHNNEYGWYNTDVYVYDNEGNYTKHDSSNSKRYRTQIGVYVRKLDLDGGSCSKTSITVTYKQKIGTLPTPTKIGYTFEGWYTEKTGGGKVTADTVISVAADAWLYARWKSVTTTTKATTKPTTTTTKATTTTTKPTTTTTTTTTTKPTTTTTTTTTTSTTTTTTTVEITTTEITTMITSTTEISTTTPPVTTEPAEDDKVAGDANSDGIVNLKDVIIIRQFVANWDVEIDTEAADVNNDGVVDLKDVILVRRFIAGGWDIELI